MQQGEVNNTRQIPQRSFNAWDAVALLLYIGLTSTLAFFHECWADEVQAWLIARDCTLRQIFFTRMHYEGAPGLWHLVLWFPAHIGLPIGAMQAIAVLFCSISIFLLLRWSPFPTWLRLALPFTAALVYQAPIVSRSYSLTIVLAVALTVLIRNRSRSILWIALLCGLVANTSVFGFAFSMGFAFLAAVAWRRFDRRRLVVAAGLLAVLWFVAIWTALPAPDEDSGMGVKLNSHPAAQQFFSKVTGIPIAPAAVTATAPNSDPDPASLKPPMHHAWQSHLWDRLNGTPHLSAGTKLLKLVIMATSLGTYILSPSAIFGIVFYLVLLVWLCATRSLIWFVPFVLEFLSIFGGGADPNHVLLLWAALVCSFWMAWPDSQADAPVRLPWLQCAVMVLLVATVAQQILWAGHAYAWDLRNAYDPGRDTARFLKALPSGTRIAAFDYDTLTANGYARSNFYYNQASTYWPWRSVENPHRRFEEILAQRPDVLVTARVRFGTDQLVQSQILPWAMDPPQGVDEFQKRGYRVEQTFCANQPTRMGFHHEDCIFIYRLTEKH